MARLIPSFVDDHTPPGERDVFGLLSAGPNDWVILHSLDVAPWNGQRRTEIDFVVIVPDTGFLCVEVKSHANISFDGARWSPPAISRSPFKQALDARYAFHRRLQDIAPWAGNIPTTHCCIFPRAAFDLPIGLSVQPNELIDARALRGMSSGAVLCADLRRRMRRAIANDPQLKPLASPITPQQVESIVGYCVPVQRRRPDQREGIALREQEADRLLRAQQKPVLQLASINARVVVSGGAGTGKTLIAMELARRAAEQGHRVALLCFNRLIADWMRQSISKGTPRPPNLIVDRAIRVMVEMAEIKVPQAPTRDFWDGELIDMLEDRLTEPDFRAASAFDYLVLDEAQDILARPRLWNCLLQFLTGGLEDGRFTLLGDFDNQVLGERAVVERTLADAVTCGACTRWHLSENCRNYAIIGDTAVRMSGLTTPVYSHYLRSGGTTEDLALTPYDSPQLQREALERCIYELKASGYRDREITILSFCEASLSAAAQLAGAGKAVSPADKYGGGTSYASVQAYKGMENQAVILTDLVVGDRDFHRHLFYTAMTRSTGPVRILCRQDCMAILQRWIVEGAHV